MSSKRDIKYTKPEPTEEDVLLERRNKELVLESGVVPRDLSEVKHSPKCRDVGFVLLGIFLPPVLVYRLNGKCDERFWACFWFSFLF